MLQTEEEFRKQGHLRRKLLWMSFDESKPTAGLSEEIFKLFCSGGMLALRRNHEAETRYASRGYAGESWCMDPNDAPIVPKRDGGIVQAES